MIKTIFKKTVGVTVMWLALLPVILLIQSCGGHKNTNDDTSFTKQYLKQWKMESSLLTPSNEQVVSSYDFNDTGWLTVQVPTTVLRALVKAGVYPDPHFDLNNFKIPDANDDMNKRFNLEKFSYIKGHPNPFKHPYWFRTRFVVPENNNGKRVWLNFDGINYRADVWLNGKQVAGHQQMVGMFSRFKFDVSDKVYYDKENILAVKIYQVDHTGNAMPGRQLEVFGHPRGQGEAIFKDATLKFSAGWDCAPVVRDRNMGLYQDVYLTYTNAVDIIDPYIVTDLPLPDTTSAAISISTQLKNVSNATVKGVLRGSIDLLNEVDFYSYKKRMNGKMKTVRFEKEVEVPAGKTIEVKVTPKEFPQLVIKNPYLWWPNGYGAQYLHNLKLSFETGGRVSDVENILFGIREFDSELKEINGEYGRTFYVNGKRIFLRGGWLQPDMMLDMNKKRVYDEARLLANANINVLANEDMPSPPGYLMETYDKYGLLMWETFFQCWTSYPGTGLFNNPEDADLAVKGAEDIIKRNRNHPSLITWTLQCETIVRDEIYTPVRNLIRTLDSTRIFVPTTSYGWDVDSLTPYMSSDIPTGMTDEGAPDYTWYPHEYYYDMVEKVHQQMFRDEMGVPSVPVYSSMKKFIFDLGKGPKNDIYPLDKNWAHHGAWDDVDGYSYVYRPYDVALRSRYGAPSSAMDYIRKAQYVNAGSYRAMYEAANHRMWDITQGVMLWKLNSTWPTVVWQIYDWFLNPTSAYYFTKKALEPVHIQLNENDFTVSVINTKHKELKDMSAVVKVYNFDLSEKWRKEKSFSMGEDQYKELFRLPGIDGLSKTYFVKLQLKDKTGKQVSENFYWLSSAKGTDQKVHEALKRAYISDKKYAKKVDYKDLATLKPVKLNVKYTIKTGEKQTLALITVRNNSDRLAFMNRLMVTKGKGGEELLPSIWSDNFVTLMPGEEKELTVQFSTAGLNGKEPVIVQDTTIY